MLLLLLSLDYTITVDIKIRFKGKNLSLYLVAQRADFCRWRGGLWVIWEQLRSTAPPDFFGLEPPLATSGPSAYIKAHARASVVLGGSRVDGRTSLTESNKLSPGRKQRLQLLIDEDGIGVWPSALTACGLNQGQSQGQGRVFINATTSVLQKSWVTWVCHAQEHWRRQLWGRASLDFQLCNFSGHFRAAQTLIRLRMVAYPVKITL